MDFCLIVFAILSGVSVVLFGAMGLMVRVADTRLRARTNEVLDAIGGLRTALVEASATRAPLPEPTSARSALPAGAGEVPPTVPESRPRRVPAEERAMRQVLGELADDTTLPSEGAAAPPARDSTDEMTHVYSRVPGAVDARPPSVTVRRLPPEKTPPPRPQPIRSERPTMTPGAFARAKSDPTPRTGTPVPPRPASTPPELPSLRGVPASMDERIAERYAALCDASNAAGEPADHCDGPMCMHTGPSMCRCHCDACRRATAFLLQAQDENPGE